METKTQVINIGDTLWTWCGVCMERTDHKFTGHSLVCLDCQAEREKQQQKKGGDNGNDNAN